MKKTTAIFIILITLAPFSSNAQFLKCYGFKVGVHFSNHIWNYSDSFLDNFYNMPPKSRFLFELGVFGEFFGHRYLSFVSEITIIPKGAEFEYDKKNSEGVTIGKDEFIARLNYYSFSEKLKARFFYKKYAAVYFFAGPKLDILSSRPDRADFKNVYDNFKRTVYGIIFGIGIEFKNVLLETQYDMDITNSIPSELGSIKNYLFSIRIGLKAGKLKNMY